MMCSQRCRVAGATDVKEVSRDVENSGRQLNEHVNT